MTDINPRAVAFAARFPRRGGRAGRGSSTIPTMPDDARPSTGKNAPECPGFPGRCRRCPTSPSKRPTRGAFFPVLGQAGVALHGGPTRPRCCPNTAPEEWGAWVGAAFGWGPTAWIRKLHFGEFNAPGLIIPPGFKVPPFRQSFLATFGH